MREREGITLPELLVSMTLAVVLAAALAPSLAGLGRSARLAAAVRALVVCMQGLRSRSIAQATSYGMLFRRDTRGWYWWVTRDGNGNGLRTAEIRIGQDRLLSGPHRLSDFASGTQFGFPPIPSIRALPTRGGSIVRRDRPIRLGSTLLLSFTPLGGSSSGTLYVTDGRARLAAVVLYGRTGRIRVYTRDPASGRWRL
jgi:Tfp pilus assembly protein FimT